LLILDTLLALVLGGLACLLPPAVYCLALASLNHRPRPTVVPGTWDFLGVLLSTSGFLIFGGPAVLSGIHKGLLPRGRFIDLRGYDGSEGWWPAAWLAYFVVVVAGAAWLLWKRRLVTSIYNVDADRFPQFFGQLLDRLGCDWARRGDVFFIGSDGRAVVELSAAAGLRHVTLRWGHGAGPLRNQIESELRIALAHVEPPSNPLVGWFLSVATALFAVLFFGLVFFLVVVYSTLRR
jgi:hypothetical protein